MIRSFYVEMYDIEEDADDEVLRQAVEDALRARLPYVELSVAVAE